MRRTSSPRVLPLPDAGSRLLSNYGHASGCADCCRYATDQLRDHHASTVVAATLARHDVGHRFDPSAVASQHF